MALLSNRTIRGPERPFSDQDVSRPVSPVYRATKPSIFPLGCALLCVLWLSSSVWAQSSAESMLKAAFLYNFAKFVEWPTDALPAESDPFMICVIGEPRMAEATNRFVKDKLIHDRIVRARTPDSMSDVQSCHLLFIDASAGPVAKKLKHSAMTLPILTVGESDRFLSQGGIINLFVEEGRMRFEISPQAAERVQLKISSKLLTLAKITDAP